MSYELYIERLMQFFTSGSFREEVAEAKKKFFSRAGVFDEESPDFEYKTSQFTDWYLFGRPLLICGLTPIQLAIKNADFPITEEERPYFENLAANRHSLFEFLKIKGADVFLRDLLKDENIVVENASVTIGFNPEEIFETRLIPHQGNYVFTKSFCFHPAEATPYIRKECQKAKGLDREDWEQLISKLFMMRYKHDQYKHVKLNLIYSNQATIRV